MALWLIRAGSKGQTEGLALEHGVAVIGWEDLPDMTPAVTREELAELLRRTYPNEKPKTLMNWESQLWPFRDAIKLGDLVALPLKTRSAIAIGRIDGAYCYRTDLPGGPFHTRPVKWLGEYPRSAFDQDLLFSFGAFMTVCRIQRNQAEERVRALLEGKAAPRPGAAIVPAATGNGAGVSAGEQADAASLPDLELLSQDLIRTRIAQRFRGHALTTLVAAILQAQGYRLQQAPEGPDSGVDIIAGSGPSRRKETGCRRRLSPAAR